MIKRIAPDVEVIDITHGIEPQQVLQGALVLANTLPYMPAGVHVAVEEPHRLDVPAPEIGRSRLRATVLYVDRYGNVQLNATTDDLERVGMLPGEAVELDVGFESYFAVVATTFADVRPGDILLYEDAYRNVALAINGGNAAEMLSARSGQEIRISRAHA